MCEQNRAGLLSTVPPPEGAERRPIEKFAPPPRPNWGPDPQFLYFTLRVPRTPTNPENFVKMTRPIFEKKISKLFDLNLIFFELGEFPTREKVTIDAPLPLYMWSKFGPDRRKFRYI